MNLKAISFSISESVGILFNTEDSFIDIFSHLNRMTTIYNGCKP